MSTIPIDYLIKDLRLRVGDIDPDNYRYLDEWLLASLIAAVKALGRYWYNKYIINSKGVVYRNPDSGFFDFDESYGVIEPRDEDIIVLKAAIIILQGSLENSAWDAISWRDNEISFSNLEKSRSRNDNLQRFIDELNKLLVPPTKRLATPSKQSLPGYLNNPYENTDDYNNK